MRARLRFQPRFRVLAVERMVAVRRLGRARAVEFLGQALDLASMSLLAAPDDAPAQAERAAPRHRSSANSMPRTRRLTRPRA